MSPISTRFAPLPFPLKGLCVAVTYAASAWFAQELIYRHSDVCALWPAAGVGLAGVLWARWEGAAGTFLGSLAAVALFFSHKLVAVDYLATAFVTGVGATTAAVLGAWIVRRYLGGREQVLDRFRSQLWFVFYSLVCSATSAIMGVWVRRFFALIPDNDVGVDFLLWTVGDTLGVLTVAPFLFALWRQSNAFLPVRWWEYGAFVGLTMSTALVAFSTTYPLTVGLLLPILWSCFYLPQYWSLGVSLAIAVVATAATSAGYGSLVRPESALLTALSLYPFVFVTAVTALCVSAGLQLRVRRKELEDLLQVSPVGILWSDEQTGRVTRVNQQLATDLGYASAGELLALPDMGAIYADPRDRQRLLDKVGRRGDGRGHHRFVAKRKDGSKIWLHVYARRVIREGRPHILGFAHEVTDGQRRRRLGRIVRKLAKRTVAGARYR